MTDSTSSGPIIAAIERTDPAAQLIRTACDLARLNDTSVTVVTVAIKRRESPMHVLSDEMIIEEYAQASHGILTKAAAVTSPDVEIDHEIVVGNSVIHGLTKKVQALNAQAVVAGWRDRDRATDTILGTSVDRMIERLTCDLFVEKIGVLAEQVDSILVPVAGGPNVRPAITVAKAIADENEATIALVSIAGSGIDRETAAEAVSEARTLLESLPGPAIEYEPSVLVENSIEQAILDRLADHDIAVLGITSRGAFQRRLVGSIAETVASKSDRTTIMAQAAEAATGRPFQLSQVWSRR